MSKGLTEMWLMDMNNQNIEKILQDETLAKSLIERVVTYTNKVEVFISEEIIKLIEQRLKIHAGGVNSLTKVGHEIFVGNYSIYHLDIDTSFNYYGEHDAIIALIDKLLELGSQMRVYDVTVLHNGKSVAIVSARNMSITEALKYAFLQTQDVNAIDTNNDVKLTNGSVLNRPTQYGDSLICDNVTYRVSFSALKVADECPF